MCRIEEIVIYKYWNSKFILKNTYEVSEELDYNELKYYLSK